MLKIVRKRLFAKRNLSKVVEKAAKEAGFTKLLPVQKLVVENVDHGKSNILVRSPTGSGKTLAFLLPVVDHILQNPSTNSSQVLIIAPSRDLGIQIMKELRKLFEHLQDDFVGDWMSFCAFISGGKSTKSNLFFLQKSPRIVIGSPGILLEMVGSEMIEPDDFELVVLDEIDQLLSKGFSEETEEILSLIYPARYLGFSATNSVEFEDRLRIIAGNSKNFCYLETEDERLIEEMRPFETSSTLFHYKKSLKTLEITPSSIAQVIAQIRSEFANEFGSTIVFCNKKREVDALAGSLRLLENAPWNAVYQIHGDFQQNQRNKIMKAVRYTTKSLLIGTWF